MKTKAGTNRTVPIHPRIRPLVIKWYNKAQELNSEYLYLIVLIRIQQDLI